MGRHASKSFLFHCESSHVLLCVKPMYKIEASSNKRKNNCYHLWDIVRVHLTLYTKRMSNYGKTNKQEWHFSFSHPRGSIIQQGIFPMFAHSVHDIIAIYCRIFRHTSKQASKQARYQGNYLKYYGSATMRDSVDEILEREMVIGETLARELRNTLGAPRE